MSVHVHFSVKILKSWEIISDFELLGPFEKFVDWQCAAVMQS